MGRARVAALGPKFHSTDSPERGDRVVLPCSRHQPPNALPICGLSVFNYWSAVLQGEVDLLSRRSDLIGRMSLPILHFSYHLETSLHSI